LEVLSLVPFASPVGLLLGPVGYAVIARGRGPSMFRENTLAPIAPRSKRNLLG